MENETIVFIELDPSVFYLENCLTSLRVSNTFVVFNSRVLSFILFFGVFVAVVVECCFS